MLTRDKFIRYNMNIAARTDNPVIKYKINKYYLKEARTAEKLYPDFMASPAVRRMHLEQKRDGTWGHLYSKDYALKEIIPTFSVGIERCLYLGLTLDDGDMLLMALDYIEDVLEGREPMRIHGRNERAPAETALFFASLAESIKPYNPLGDTLWQQWLYVVSRAFETGEYSYDADKSAQEELFFIKGERLIPHPLSFLLRRRDAFPEYLERAVMMRCCPQVYAHGHMWSDMTLSALPADFVHPKTSRLFRSVDYINMFRGNREYLSEVMDWFASNVRDDTYWDCGPQIKDPWGYFRSFSDGKRTKAVRAEDCTMEILHMMDGYLTSNGL